MTTPVRPRSTFTVCVFCSASQEIDPRHIALAASVGTAIAEHGWTLVSGGGSVSMMGALARAARAAGGHTVGVIPEALAGHEVADLDADELVVTPDMRSRKQVMDDRSDAFLTLAGGIGTLEEFMEIWVARSLGMHGKPLVVLDPDGHYALLHALADHLVERGFMRAALRDAIAWTTDVPSAVHALRAPQTVLRSNDADVLESDP